MFCIKCGTNLVNDALYCSNCGYKINTNVNDMDSVSTSRFPIYFLVCGNY